MKRFAPILLVLAVAPSCDDSEPQREPTADGGGGGKADGQFDEVDTKGFHFVLDDGQFTTRRDHAGAPLLATIWGRHAEYNIDAPFVEEHADGLEPWLLHITKTFHMVHSSWAPSLRDMGLDTCDDLGVNDDLFADFSNGKIDFGNLFQLENCFAQETEWPNPDKNFELEEYRRTIEVSLPDYLTIEFDEPAAFPNGRVLHEQINSLMFAMAFLDQGGDCHDNDGNPETCSLHTLWHRNDFLKPQNDVPFRGATELGEPAREFPWLADPHRM